MKFCHHFSRTSSHFTIILVELDVILAQFTIILVMGYGFEYYVFEYYVSF